jgi:hypothetical protein
MMRPRAADPWTQERLRLGQGQETPEKGLCYYSAVVASPMTNLKRSQMVTISSIRSVGFIYQRHPTLPEIRLLQPYIYRGEELKAPVL